MTHDSSYIKCSYITPTLSHLIPLHSDENPQRTFYFLHHDKPAVVSHNAQHRTKDYVSLIEVLLDVPLTFATSMLQTRRSGFHRAERTKLHRNFAPNHPNWHMEFWARVRSQDIRSYEGILAIPP